MRGLQRLVWLLDFRPSPILFRRTNRLGHGLRLQHRVGVGECEAEIGEFAAGELLGNVGTEVVGSAGSAQF